MKQKAPVAMIEVVAKGLGPLKKKVVFIGGATVALYLKGTTNTAVRPTDDVDCVIEIMTRQNYSELQAALEKVGFRHSMEEQVPICRMDFKGLKVDIMPSDPRILGFSNMWYTEGMQHAIETKLPNGDTVLIFSLPYFVATKIEAYFERGQGDFRLSSDIEDVITVLAGQSDFEDLLSASETVKAYLKKNFRMFVADPLFLQSLLSHLDSGPDREEKAEHLLNRINRFCVV